MITDIFFRAKRKVFFWKNLTGQKATLCSPNKLCIDLKINDCQKWVDIEVYNVKIVFKIQLLKTVCLCKSHFYIN